MPQRLIVWTLIATSTIGGFALGRSVARVAAEPAPLEHRLADALAAAVPGAELDEVSLIYYGSSACRWSRRAEVIAAVRTGIDTLLAFAQVTGARVSLVGVDVAPVSGRELAHLNQIAKFDQVSLGGRSLNQVGVSLLGRGEAGVGETPQLIVVHRTVRRESPRGGPMTVSLGPSRVVLRLVGLSEIVEWAGAGAVFPLIGSAELRRDLQ